MQSETQIPSKIKLINNNINFSEKILKLFWYALPLIMAFAAIAPVLLNVISAPNGDLANLNHINPDNYFLHDKIAGKLGTKGLIGFSVIISIFIAYGIFKLAREFNAPLWARSVAACVWLALPVFNLAPNFYEMPDAGVFAALCVWLAYVCLKTVRTASLNQLGLAYALATIISWLHPLNIWAPILVFLVTHLTSAAFRRETKYGLIISLCWGSGLFWVRHIVAQYIESGLYGMKNIAAMTRDILHDATNSASNSGIMFLGNLPHMLPLVILLLAGIFALINFGLKERKIIRNFYALLILAASFVIIAAFGGNLVTSRLLLDPLLFALIASLANYNHKNFMTILEKVRGNLGTKNAKVA